MLIQFNNTSGTDSVNLDEALEADKKSGDKTAHQSLLSESWQTTKEFILWTAKTAVPWTYHKLVKPTVIYGANAAVWAFETGVPWTYHKLVKPTVIYGANAAVWALETGVPWTYHKMVPLMEKLHHRMTQTAQSTWRMVQIEGKKVSIAAASVWASMQKLPQHLNNKIFSCQSLVNQKKLSDSHGPEMVVPKENHPILTQKEVAEAIKTVPVTKAANERVRQSMATTVADLTPCNVEALKQIDGKKSLVNTILVV